MASDWIKMRVDLHDDPDVERICALTGLDSFSVIGRLHAFWAYADRFAVEGRIYGMTPAAMDKRLKKKGFCEALNAVGWLDAFGEKTGQKIQEFSEISPTFPIFLEIPRHERHNGKSAKDRAQKNVRQSKWRQSVDAPPSTNGSTPPSTPASTKASTREDKRREDNKSPLPPLRKGDVLDSSSVLPWGERLPAEVSRAELLRIDVENCDADVRDLDTREIWFNFGPRWQKREPQLQVADGGS
jgi:hypothetical protein